MHTLTVVLLEEAERYLLNRVAHLTPLAYPTSTEPAHLRPAAKALVVDARDPRLRILARIATERGPITYPMARLAVEVLDALVEVVSTQADPGWWLQIATCPDGQPNWEGAEAMAKVMAEERAAQVPRLTAARSLMAQAVAQMTPRDDPEWWAAAEDDHAITGPHHRPNGRSARTRA